MNNDAEMKHKHKSVIMKDKHTHNRTNRDKWKITPICISSFDAVMEIKVISPARLPSS